MSIYGYLLLKKIETEKTVYYLLTHLKIAVKLLHAKINNILSENNYFSK